MRDVIMRQKQEKDRMLRAVFVEREVSEKVSRCLGQDIIKVVTGVRRCGKSVFCFMALKGVPFAYVNFDEKELAKAKNYEEILKYLKELYGDFRYILLDEVQNVGGWELWVNSLQRRGYNLLITGSNAKLLSMELATHLTGRHLSLELFPFSFREFAAASGFASKGEYTEEERGGVLNLLKRYIEIGGFPDVVVKGYDQSYLQGLFDSIILKDVVKRYNVRYPDDLYNLARYLVSSFAKEASFTKLKNVLNFRSVHTVQNYVGYLEETYLVFSLDRFSFRQKEQMKAPKKIYAIDTGLINSIAFRFTENTGRLMENAVAVELLRRRSSGTRLFELYYYRDNFGKEVDFVVKKGAKVKQLIQVCYNIEDLDTKVRETHSLIRASEELGCNDLLIITWDYEGNEKTGGKKIVYTPLWKWLWGGKGLHKNNKA